LLLSHATDQLTHFTAQYYPSNLAGSGSSMRPIEGKPLFGLYSKKWAGLDPLTGDPMGYDKEGKVSKDYISLNDPQSVSEVNYIGSSRPTWFGGIRNTVAYKAWSVSFNITYKLGYYFMRESVDYSSLFNYNRYHEDYSKRWQQPGDEKKTSVPSAVYPVNSNRDYFYNSSDALVEPSDHVRFKDISLSYGLKNKKILSLPVQALDIYLYANNLGLIWKATDTRLDPDNPSGGTLAPRTIAVGIKATL
jgi:hypothetical protein